MSAQYEQQYTSEDGHRAVVQAADHAARDGEEPARHGYHAAGDADDGPGPAVPDAGGDAADDVEGLRRRHHGRGYQARRGHARRLGQDHPEGRQEDPAEEEVDAISGVANVMR